MANFERTQVELVGGWIVVGAMQGRMEPFDKFWSKPWRPAEPCRDDFRLNAEEGDTCLSFAVADGVSSQPNSDKGARVAVETAADLLKVVCRAGFPGEEALVDILASVHEALDRRAQADGAPLDTLATTLTIGAMDRIKGELVCASIGDGYVLTRNRAGDRDWWFPSAMRPDPTGATPSLTARAWRTAVNFDRCPFPVQTVIAVTDGLQQVMFQVDRTGPGEAVRTPYARAITAIIGSVTEQKSVSRTRALSTFLGMRENTALMADDRTVVVFQSLADLGKVVIPTGATHASTESGSQRPPQTTSPSKEEKSVEAEPEDSRRPKTRRRSSRALLVLVPLTALAFGVGGYGLGVAKYGKLDLRAAIQAPRPSSTEGAKTGNETREAAGGLVSGAESSSSSIETDAPPEPNASAALSDPSGSGDTVESSAHADGGGGAGGRHGRPTSVRSVVKAVSPLVKAATSSQIRQTPKPTEAPPAPQNAEQPAPAVEKPEAPKPPEPAAAAPHEEP